MIPKRRELKIWVPLNEFDIQKQKNYSVSIIRKADTEDSECQTQGWVDYDCENLLIFSIKFCNSYGLDKISST